MSEIKVNKLSPRTNCGTVTVGDSGDSVSVTAGVPVTVNGDLKSNALKAVDGGSIISQCGTSITLGASGDTINLAAGATQSGFGRTGTVDWDTTAKTADFTAVSGNGYFVNTTSGAITVTLPASPSAGDIVSVSDYAQTSDTNNITLARNGSNIEGDASDLVIQNKGVAMTFVYADATKGWKVVNAGAESDREPVTEYIVATGGTITCCGDYKIHTFTSPGTFTVTSAGNELGSTIMDYMVVAGGGGGGGVCGGGGGGGGGFRESVPSPAAWTASPLASTSGITASIQAYPVTVGGGGLGGQSASNNCDGAQGSNSVFSTITSTGGGGGGAFQRNGTTGGSGGGGGGRASIPGSAGNTPPVSPPQGQPGGGSTPSPSNPDRGGGGGGATAAGTTAPGCLGGPGGAGATTSISGSPVARAGGGGGGWDGGSTRSCGADGGGDGGTQPLTGLAGTTNTGGGGGGAGESNPSQSNKGGNGGSGIVVIRYKFQ